MKSPSARSIKETVEEILLSQSDSIESYGKAVGIFTPFEKNNPTHKSNSKILALTEDTISMDDESLIR